MPLNPSILRYQPVETPDPGQTFARYLSLREMLDQRRYRDQQYRAQELLARQREQEMQRGEAFRQAVGSGATLSDLMRIDPTRAIALQKSVSDLETAGLTRQKTQSELQTAELNRQKTGFDVAAAERKGRQEKLQQYIRDMRSLLTLPPNERAQAYEQMKQTYRARGEEMDYDAPMPTAEQLNAMLVQAYDEKDRLAIEETQGRVARQPYQLRADIAQAQTAEQKATGTEPPTGTIKEFTELFEPGYYASKGITKPTQQDRMQAYSAFQEMRRPRIEVPGVDVPLSPAVAQQRVDIATAQAKAAATDKPLSAEAAKVKTVADTLIPEAQQLKEAIRSGGRTAITGILTGTDTTLRRLAESVADKVGRLRSGGAINKDEEARFMGQIATWRDIWGGGQAPMDALDRLITEAQGVSGSMGGKPAQAPAGGKKDSLGIR